MKVQQQVPLAPFTTLRVGGPAQFFVEAHSEAELQEAFGWGAMRGVPVEVIGGGSNLLVADGGLPGLVIRLQLAGIEARGCTFNVAAGEPWDGFVDRAIEAGCQGVECLAGVPGSTGATPVQNVGAYGQEVAQVICGVRALDRRSGKITELSAEDCRFRYRRSIFNTEERGRFVITRVCFALRHGAPPALGYADLERWFAGRADPPTLAEVARAVRTIRGHKGMVLAESDPDTWSAGSYFKNPLVDLGTVSTIASAAGVTANQVPHWPTEPERAKLSAAWLLERAGFGKGFSLGPAGLSTKHALALTNRGSATCADILRLEAAIRDGVHERFGVLLEREPVLLGSPDEQRA